MHNSLKPFLSAIDRALHAQRPASLEKSMWILQQLITRSWLHNYYSYTELLYDRCLLMTFLRERACPFHCYPYTVSSLVTSFSSTQVLGTIFLFSTLFSISSSMLAACWILPAQKEISMMHVLQTLLYFRINWYWFRPEIRHWLNFNSISFAPKLPNHFQAQNTVAPKAHGHTAPARATQDTPRVWQNSLGSCYPFPNLRSQRKNQKGKSAGCLLSFVPIAKLWKR